MVVAAALVLPAWSASACVEGPGACTEKRPIHYQDRCRSEAQVAATFKCPRGTVQVFRQRARAGSGTVTMHWNACCQNERNQSHCIEFARGHGVVGEHWVCPPSKDWHKKPCGAYARN